MIDALTQKPWEHISLHTTDEFDHLGHMGITIHDSQKTGCFCITEHKQSMIAVPTFLNFEDHLNIIAFIVTEVMQRRSNEKQSRDSPSRFRYDYCPKGLAIFFSATSREGRYESFRLPAFGKHQGFGGEIKRIAAFSMASIW